MVVCASGGAYVVVQLRYVRGKRPSSANYRGAIERLHAFPNGARKQCSILLIFLGKDPDYHDSSSGVFAIELSPSDQGLA